MERISFCYNVYRFLRLMAASERRGNMNRNRRRKISRAIRRKQVNRNYKDSLFRMIFGNRKAALKLYNAINHSNYQNPEEGAVDRAVEECIAEGILADFLKKERGEVKDVILTEYNAERHIKNEKKLSYEEGVEKGIEKGIEKGLERGIRAFITEKEEEEAGKTIIIEKLQKHFMLDREKAEYYYEKFSKKM